MKTVGERFVQVLWCVWAFLMLLTLAFTWSDLGFVGSLLLGPVIGIPIWILQRPLVGYWSVVRLFSS